MASNKHCCWCGRPKRSCVGTEDEPCLSRAGRVALQDYIEKTGKGWRQWLVMQWTAGRRMLGELRGLIGSQGLRYVDPPKRKRTGRGGAREGAGPPVKGRRLEVYSIKVHKDELNKFREVGAQKIRNLVLREWGRKK